MSEVIAELAEDKYLFTFQDETQLWISKEFIKKYPMLPFYDAIKHTDIDKDCIYYIDMLPFHMEKMIQFLMEDNVDISSLNLKDSYDIYKTLVEYSVDLKNNKAIDLLYHIKELFYKYLKENKYSVYEYVDDMEIIEKNIIPVELFNLGKKKIHINGLFSPQRKDELLYYSLLNKMMNITKVEITYDYSSNIPIEYMCPSNIKDIFPSLEESKINVTTHYKKTELLLNPNNDEYIMEYIRLFSNNDYEIENPEKYEYYTESEMNEYNKISSLDLNKIYYSQKLIDSYNKRREKNELPKLYKYIVNEAIYTNDYSEVEINEIVNEYTLIDTVSIKYDDKTNDKTFIINGVSSIYGIAQLLLLPSYLSISKIILNKDYSTQYNPFIVMKLLEEELFDSLTALSVRWIKELTNEIDESLFMKIMTTHVLPNVTELIYDDPTENFDSLFPDNLISMIDTIRIDYIECDNKKEMFFFLDNIIYTHSIHINISGTYIPEWFYCFPHLNELFEKDLITFDIISSDDIDYIEDNDNNDNNNNNNNPDEIDKKNSLERFLKKDISLNTSSEGFTVYENIMEKLIPKASIVDIEYWTMTSINRLIHKGCFHNTTQLILHLDSVSIDDVSDENFFKLYTTDNFPQLKYIQFYGSRVDRWRSSFIKTFYTFMNNNNFPSSSIVQLGDHYWITEYIYDPNNSIFRFKYNSNSFMGAFYGTKDEEISKSEIQELFNCINDNKAQNLTYLIIYIYDEEQLSKLIDFITTGKIPQLEECIMNINKDISDEQIIMYKQQLSDSLFIQENHVSYEFDTFY
ncbi:hypothetical protein WA158_000747 [Blastocystis sp. Blastoise]